jgi:hypothetical protein
LLNFSFIAGFADDIERSVTGETHEIQ